MKLIRLLKQDLATEAQAWVHQGFISRDQAELLLGSYGTSLDSSERRNMGYYALLSLGALCAGIALILLLSHNWQEIPKLLRGGILISATLVFSVSGVFTYRTREHIGRALMILGTVAYGATIFLIAQMYHLQVDFPLGLLLWIAGALPLALLAESVTLILLSLVLGTVWAYGQFQWYPVPLLPPEVYITFPLIAAAALYFCVAVRSSIIAFLGTCIASLFVAEFGISHLTGTRFGIAHIVFVIGAQLAFYALGLFLENKKISEQLIDYGVALKLWAMRFGIVTMFILSYQDPWRELLRGASRASHLPAVFALVLVPTIVLGIAAFATMLKERRGSEILPLVTFGLAFGGLIAVCLGFGYTFGDPQPPLVVFQTIVNALLICTGIWIVRSGSREQRTSAVTFGTAIILLLGLLRYFDLIGGYLGTAAIFFLEAVVMIAVAQTTRRLVFAPEENL